MTSEKLLSQLNNLEAHTDNYLIGGALTIVGLIMLVFVFAVYLFNKGQLKYVKNQETDEEKVVKDIREKKIAIILMLVIALGVTSTGVAKKQFSNLSTMEEKQTEYSPEIREWEQSKDFQKYINSLPKEITETSEIKKQDYGSGLTATVKINNKTQEVEISATDVVTVRKSDQAKHPDLPQTTYLVYKVNPTKLTYNYPKDKIIPFKLVKIEDF